MTSEVLRARRLWCATMLAVPALACVSSRALAHDDTVDGIVGGLIILTFLLPIYIAPAIIALVREHHDRWAILVANLLLGVTGIGWIGCLIWSLTAVHRGSSHHQEAGNAGSSGYTRMQPAVSATAQAKVPLEALEQLKILLDKGAVDQEEFDLLKLRLLRGGSGGA